MSGMSSTRQNFYSAEQSSVSLRYNSIFSKESVTVNWNEYFINDLKVGRLRKQNIQKINDIKEMWINSNQNNHHVILNTLDCIYHLNEQPELFPTFRESIQLEYEKENGEYL